MKLQDLIHTTMNAIKTLNQLADYINSDEYNQLEANRIIEANGWTDLCGENDYDVCAFNGEKVTLDEDTGKAYVAYDPCSERASLRDIADEYGLEYVETTDQRNGYPSNIMGAIIGMDNFDIAEEIAAKYNLDIELINKRDGWQLWHRTGNWAVEPLKITEDVFSDDTRLFTADDADEYFANEVKPFLEDCDGFDSAMEIIANGKTVYGQLCLLGNDEAAVVVNGVYNDTISLHPMQFTYDTKTDAIALVRNDK